MKRQVYRKLQWVPLSLRRKGQAAVEFALVLTVAMIVLFVAIQMAVIGQAALALGQANYQVARWVAVNSSAHCSDVVTQMTTNSGLLKSPTITKKGVSCQSGSPGPGQGLYITMLCQCPQGQANPPPNCSAFTNFQDCSTSPATRPFGWTVQVQFLYDTQAQMMLSNPFLGIPFPQTLSSTESAMTE